MVREDGGGEVVVAELEEMEVTTVDEVRLRQGPGEPHPLLSQMEFLLHPLVVKMSRGRVRGSHVYLISIELT